MKKRDEYEAWITGYEFQNKGIAYIEERKVTIKGAFEGQKVRIQIIKMKNGTAEGRLLEVLESSPEETETPDCKHFGQCGGCLYQTYPYKSQLAIKEKQVRSLLDTACQNNLSQNYVWEGILPSPREQGYRNKMEFSFGDEYKDGPLALGLHRKGSFYDLVTVTDCKIVDSDYNQILGVTLPHFAKLDIPYYKKMNHEGSLRHLVVRRTAATGELLINLVVSSQIKMQQTRQEHNLNEADARVLDLDKCQLNADGRLPDSDVREGVFYKGNLEDIKKYLCLDAWIEALLTIPLHGSIAGVLITINDSLADVVQSDEMHVLYGRNYIYEEILGLRFKITPFSFFQTNSLGAEVLYERVRSYVGDTKNQVIFDLYSGTGTIAQILAPIAKKVVGVEIVEEAVEAARNNAVLNHLSNCEFIAGDVLKVLDNLTDLPDMIVLDPPRDGIHPKALTKILRYGVERMVYISCKPTSLVRDLVTLQAEGYRVEKACCVDMFPWTGNVETVCLLSKLHSKHHIEVELHMDEMDLTAAESKATYEEIKAYVLEHSGLNVSNLYIAQVKQKYGIIERECYNKPKSEDSRQPKCPPEKEAAITEALKYFKMI